MDLRYPIGTFEWKGELSDQQRRECIAQIAETPARLREAVAGLSAEQLETPYRPEGWTVRQLVHHLPDSHLNAYVRVKLALTEDEPLVKTYEEALWAQLPDSASTPAEVSLALLEALHTRWVDLMRSLTAEQFRRTYRHPQMGVVSLEKLVALYAWHGRHHVAHITSLRERMGWNSQAASR